jgi:hypothetical protein
LSAFLNVDETMSLHDDFGRFWEETKPLLPLILGICLAALMVNNSSYLYKQLIARNRPWILTRGSAATAIERCAEFRHKTKLFFTVSQVEGIIPGACHNFQFSGQKIQIVQQYLNSGSMKFCSYGNQNAPFGPASVGSIDLSIGDGSFLLDKIDSCKNRAVGKSTGEYELRLGKAVVEVTGIRKNGDQAIVDFKWHFTSINEVGLMLPRIKITRQYEMLDEHLTAEEKSIAPFWVGVGHLTKYDDGWRVASIDLGSSLIEPQDWAYGPLSWPDPDFNWNAFDENENRQKP